MKQLIIIVLCSLLSISLFSQELANKIISKNLYNIDILDSTVIPTEHEITEDFNLKLYSSRFVFEISNGNILKLNVYRDSLMYYQELDTAGYYIYGGEMRIDTSVQKVSLNPYKTYNEVGELVDSYDTTYYWVKDGTWKIPVTENMLQVTTYNMGTKIEEYIELNSSCPEFVRIQVPTEKYSLDLTSKKIQFELPKNRQIKTLISGKWYHSNCRIITHENDTIWIFVREKPIGHLPDGGRESNFSKNGDYSGINRFSCGTGRTKEDYLPESKWKVTKQVQLEIGTSKFEIVYLGKEMMILK